MAQAKQLMRDPERAVLGGVLAGIADYLDVDPTVVRVVTVLIAIFTAFFPVLLAYVVLYFVMPPKPAAAGAAPAPALEQPQQP